MLTSSGHSFVFCWMVEAQTKRLWSPGVFVSAQELLFWEQLIKIRLTGGNRNGEQKLQVCSKVNSLHFVNSRNKVKIELWETDAKAHGKRCHKDVNKIICQVLFFIKVAVKTIEKIHILVNLLGGGKYKAFNTPNIHECLNDMKMEDSWNNSYFIKTDHQALVLMH